jgi:hypothetical protein
MQTLELPDKLAKRLESFKRSKGRKWTTELENLLAQAEQLETWDKEIRMPGPKAKALSEKEAVTLAVEVVREERRKR